jgi:membrane protease YdiL (CAAX protease family)
MGEIELHFFDHLLFFILGILLPFLAVSQSQSSLKGIKLDLAMKKQIYFGNSIFQWICTALVLVCWWVYSRFFTSLGFQWGEWSSFSAGLMLLFLVLYGLDVWWELRNETQKNLLKNKWENELSILPVSFEEFKYFLLVAFTAGVCEEIIFRGFFINYFLSINENNVLGTWLSICIPAFLFAVGHIYQGGKAVAKTLIMACLFGWIFVLTKSLLILILIHFLVDVFGGLLAVKILKKDESLIPPS